MIYTEYTLNTSKNTYFDGQYAKSEQLFFDIETTGFSPNTTVLYFIGVMFYRDHSWIVGQWFNDDGYSDRELLEAFHTFTMNYKVLIHFNGDGFDIPYLCKKATDLGMNIDFCHIQSIDIYKLLKPYKTILQLPNLKLKTIERFLNIHRDDEYSGGELIAIYHKYLHTKSDDDYQLLFGHNFEDIKNMLDIADSLQYKELFDGNFEVIATNRNQSMLEIQLSTNLPKGFAFIKEGFYLQASTTEVILSIPIFSGELKYFFADYKNYYYLPIEDTAIHKSVANYMDKQYRKTATMETCYQKISGVFLPSCGYKTEKGFGTTFQNRLSYFQYSDITKPEFDNSSYVQNILNWFLH